MSEKTWHHLVREDGSACLYYTLSGVAAHFVVFDTLDPIPEQRIKDLESAITASQAREARLRESRARLVSLLYAVDEELPTGLPHYSNLVDRVGLLKAQLKYCTDTVTHAALSDTGQG